MQSGMRDEDAQTSGAVSMDVAEIKELPVEDLFRALDAGREGLSDQEAENRLGRYGYNEISEKKTGPFVKFLRSFWGPIPWMIEVAAVLSAVVHHWEDFWIISVLLVLNAVIGFWQEHKADNAIELLKQRLALQARVLRGGRWSQAAARELVPGDVVRVRLGDIIPADVKLIDGDYLLTDESALTGESLPVEKHRSDVAYSGSIARQGEMDGMVVATGMKTFFGKTAGLVEAAHTQSHFQKAVVKIGDYLILVAVVMVAIIFMVALFRHESMLETLQFALILTVAAIPAALPAVLSVTMAVGATNLAKKEAIVSKLVAIEEMAGMDILCSDKTGTITENRLTVGDLEPFDASTDSDLLAAAALASREEDRDPIDTAVIARAGQAEPAASPFKVIAFKPFDPIIKRTEATVEGARGKPFRVSKGAPQAVLALLGDSDRTRMASEVERRVNALASRGYRALGVARTDPAGEWKYIGLIGLFDPPRDDSAETIRTAQSMGIAVKMITGDHAAIAREIAGQVNLGTNILYESSFVDGREDKAEKAVEKADGFAQVFPEHKYRIVELLQRAGHFVGMTGDGVNDAPALKKADVGIAVAGATDAAKSAAAIVLTKPGLSVIIDAIKESRKIFQRMNSYAIYRIAETIRVLLFITLSIIIFNFYPVTAVMIVLLALFNDGPIMAIAFDRVRYSNQPEQWQMRIVLGVATVLGIAGVMFSFFMLYLAQEVLRLPPEMVQSLIFLKLAVAGHLTIFMARTRRPFWSIRPSALLFWTTVSTKLLATLVVVYGIYMAPIGWKLAGFVWAYALVEFVITDPLKLLAYKLVDHTELQCVNRFKCFAHSRSISK